VAPLVYVYEGGVPLEHLISCVPGVQIVVSPTGVKKVHWAENKPPNSPGNVYISISSIKKNFRTLTSDIGNQFKTI
jgi:hypothetical protein